MSVEEAVFPFPVTDSRASTELVQTRVHLDAARRSLELSLEISRRLDRPAHGVPLDELERVLAQVEEAEAALWEAAP